MPEIDWEDPCAAAAELRKVYYSLLSGSREVRVRFGDREVWYSQASAPSLRDEIARLEAKCAEKTGRARRHAITFGSYRRPF